MSTLTFKYPQKMTAKAAAPKAAAPTATAPTSTRLFKASSPAETGAPMAVFGPGKARKSTPTPTPTVFNASARSARRQARRAGKAVL